jgi:putative endonuclease
MARPHNMKFYYVYVLRSMIKDFVYVGITHDLRRRFEEHNSGSEFSTKPYIPFELIHYEAYRNEKDAKRREEYLKTTKGKTTLRTMLEEYFQQYPLPIDNAAEKPADAIICPVCQGTGKAPTKSMFTRSGKRTAGLIAICLTCRGRGWTEKSVAINQNYE